MHTVVNGVKLMGDAHHQNCTTCAEMKSTTEKINRKPSVRADKPLQRNYIDLLGPFPHSVTGNRYILVITEYLTRWCEAAAIPDITASTIASTLLQKLIFSHGCLRQLLSDQGAQFKAEVMAEA